MSALVIDMRHGGSDTSWRKHDREASQRGCRGLRASGWPGAVFPFVDAPGQLRRDFAAPPPSPLSASGARLGWNAAAPTRAQSASRLLSTDRGRRASSASPPVPAPLATQRQPVCARPWRRVAGGAPVDPGPEAGGDRPAGVNTAATPTGHRDHLPRLLRRRTPRRASRARAVAA